MTTKYCVDCGEGVMPTLRFCPQCGGRIFTEIKSAPLNVVRKSPEPSVSFTAANTSIPMKYKLTGLMYGFFMLAFLLFGGLQIYVGAIGIKHELGPVWAFAAVFVFFLFRFTLPITVGAFFGAMYLWGWPWFWAALFASPGLLLIVPGVLAFVLGMFRR